MSDVAKQNDDYIFNAEFGNVASIKPGSGQTLVVHGNLQGIGTNTQVIYNNAGTLTGSSGLTFDGTRLITGTVRNTNNLILESVNQNLLLRTGGTDKIKIDNEGNISGITPVRNLLYNGSFQVFQRSEVARSMSIASSSLIYTFDRWALANGANQASTVSSINAGVSGQHRCRVTRNNGQTGITPIYFSQSLTREMSYGTAGKNVFVSFWARRSPTFSANENRLFSTLESGTGTTDKAGYANRFDGHFDVEAKNFVLTETLTKYTMSGLVPANSTQLCLEFFWTPTGTASNDWFEISEIQLEIGELSTDFIPVPHAEEVARCKYFFQLFASGNGFGAGSTSVQMGFGFSPMRTPPILDSVSSSGVFGVPLTVTDSVANFTQSTFSNNDYADSVFGMSCQFYGFTFLTTYRPVMINDNMGAGNDVCFTSELF